MNKDDLYKAIINFDNCIEKDLYKLLELKKQPEKLTNLSSEEVSCLLEKYYRKLRKVWRSAHTVFSSYDKLCSRTFSLYQSSDKE